MMCHGGGVTRLKLHLVGHKDVLKCPNVPDQVAEEIARHLFLKEKEMPLLNLSWNGKKRRKAFRRVGSAHQVEQQEEIVEVDAMDSNALESKSNESEEKEGGSFTSAMPTILYLAGWSKCASFKVPGSLNFDRHKKYDMQCCSLSCMAQTPENTYCEVLSNPDESMHESNKEYKLICVVPQTTRMKGMLRLAILQRTREMEIFGKAGIIFWKACFHYPTKMKTEIRMGQKTVLVLLESMPVFVTHSLYLKLITLHRYGKAWNMLVKKWCI